MTLNIFSKLCYHKRLKSNIYLLNDCHKCVRFRNTFSMNEKEIRKTIARINCTKNIQLSEKAKFSSLISIKILGSGVRGTPSCLYVVSDHLRYLFNCGEGTQRLAHEHHLKLSRLGNIFITAPTWKNIGGYPGAVLTIQDAGLPSLTLHGPKGISNLHTAMEKFVSLPFITINEAKCSEDDVYQDYCMSVKYVHLKKSTVIFEREETSEYIYMDDINYYDHEINSYGKRSSSKTRAENKFSKREISRYLGTKITTCISYICTVNAKPGQLNLEKCVKYGIKPGPLLGKLKNGEDVILDDGKIVKSSDVVDSSNPECAFIVLECPTEDYLDSLVEHKKFKDYQIGGLYGDSQVKYIFHFSPENIMQNPRYVEWMKKFDPNTTHVVLNDKNECISSGGVHRNQYKLNLLHPHIFPLLQEPKIDEHTKNSLNSKEIFGNLKIHRAKVLNSINLRGPRDTMLGLNNLDVQVNHEECINEVMEIEGTDSSLENLRKEINARSTLIENSPSFPKIAMLGTGSSIPNKVRNVSGILLRIDEDTSILLDCGEGTTGQIVRLYGPKADNIFASIKAIYVSHLHADHHLGMIGVLLERKKFTSEPFFLIAPKSIESYLRFYNKLFESIESSITLVPNQGFIEHSHNLLPSDIRSNLFKKLNINNLQTEEVLHCLHSFCVALTLKNGYKIVYSGDTKPCHGVRTLGQDCDLLIHEATMEDGLEFEAEKKRHSTITQAITEGNKMNARHILLTHFSQRYCKIPLYPNHIENLNFDNVGVAYDNMEFKLSELTLLPLFYPTLKHIFSEFQTFMEERTLRMKKIK
ncbi:ribonuclease Z, mitochondrial [Chelonus insularis]|uniref:ribonuclease Z, mitochondrial n=1 Tax=Chelonus insularis TaxID=460826 RepID=UPI00158E6329|nr:ribonuclease Z, mitochondrial [Chelonus insularis]